MKRVSGQFVSLMISAFRRQFTNYFVCLIDLIDDTVLNLNRSVNSA